MNDLISRQTAIDALNKMKIYRPLDSDRYVISDCLNKIVNLPSVQPDSELVTWLLDWIWDEGQWELNWQAFPELLCRKLVTLGYLREKDGEYER